MNLGWLTDLHINFMRPEVFRAFLEMLKGHPAEVFVITGDIGEAHSCALYLKTIADAVQRPVYFVLGNHDFYQGSFAEVHARVRATVAAHKHLVWLRDAGALELTRATALVGHDAWGDTRLGDFEHTQVMLNDFLLIDDLRGAPISVRDKLLALGDEAAAHLREHLPKAFETHAQVILALHVPPFQAAAWHQGKPSDDNWVPFFACKAAGDAILDLMRARPDRKLTVLCGHTHSPGEYRPLPNVTVLTGAAEYGSPVIQRVMEVE